MDTMLTKQLEVQSKMKCFNKEAQYLALRKEMLNSIAFLMDKPLKFMPETYHHCVMIFDGFLS